MSAAPLADGSTSYYGRPILKEPTWRWYVTAYLFVGGMAGASAPLALAARLRGEDALARAAMGAAFFGAVLSPVLLIADLRDPKRFANMLRVFKPTSPMSVGSWILVGFGSCTGAAVVAAIVPALKPIRPVAEAGAAVLGPLLATYTAALLANTAIPVWHDARAELPFVFAGGALASAGSAALLATKPEDAALARGAIALGVTVELVALEAMQRRLGPLVGEPYRLGAAAAWKQRARAATLASLALVPFAGRNRVLAAACALLGLLGACSERFSIFEAGKLSARDPKYVVVPQRERLARRS